MAATGCGRPATRRCRRCGSKPVGTGACQAGSGDQGGVGQLRLVARCSSNQPGKWGMSCHRISRPGDRVPDLGSFDRQLLQCPFAFGPTSSAGDSGLGFSEPPETDEKSEHGGMSHVRARSQGTWNTASRGSKSRGAGAARSRSRHQNPRAPCPAPAFAPTVWDKQGNVTRPARARQGD